MITSSFMHGGKMINIFNIFYNAYKEIIAYKEYEKRSTILNKKE